MLPHLYLDSITTLAIPVNLGHANKVFKVYQVTFSPSSDFSHSMFKFRGHVISSIY